MPRIVDVEQVYCADCEYKGKCETMIEQKTLFCDVPSMPTIDAVPISEIYRVIAGHSNYHGDAILAALTCIAEGKDVKPIKPIEVNATIATPNKNEPLTIEELRTMNEQPVWCETLGCWGIIIIENVGRWAGIPFLLGHQGCQFEPDIESRGLVVYRMKPAEGVVG